MTSRTLSALIVLLLLPITALSQNGMIAGKVRASGGVAIVNALVELRESGGSLVGQVLTRNDGDFTFAQLAPREYQIIVTAEGYAPGKEVAQIRGAIRPLPTGVINEVVTVEIVLEPRTDSSLAAPGIAFVQDVPKPARAAYSKAVSKLAEGKSDEGISLLREAISEFDDYFDAHLTLGAEYYRRGRDNEALETLERARQINGREAAVYYTFGLVMARQQKFQAAEYAFGKASDLKSTHVGSHFNHAVALIELALRASDPEQKKSKLADADRELDRAWELSNKRLSAVLFQRARIYQERGDRESAANELESYLKAEPEAKNAASIKAAIKKLREKRQ